jgi:YesN/AraC family two-component response regulator
MKILVVDDEKLLVKGIKFNLENERTGARAICWGINNGAA